MKFLATALAFSMALLGGAARAASSTNTDYSDLWWNPAESGWGAHVTLQDDVIFTVIYVYDEQRRPRFFVAPDMRRGTGAAQGTYEGQLYRTQGPVFSGPFDPARVTSSAVGTARLVFTSPTESRLDYSVDGASVSKVLARQSWRPPNLAGDYKGGIFATATANTCRLGLPGVSYSGSLHVTQVADMVTIDAFVAPGFAASGMCQYIGRLVQDGSLARITGGTYACDFLDYGTIVTGTFDVSAIEPGENGFGGRYVGQQEAACVHTGFIGGTRRGYPDLLPAPDTP